MSELRALFDAIADLLVTDATFVAAVQAMGFGMNGQAVTPQVLRAIRPFASLGQEHFPAWMLQPGDDDTTERAVGSCHQGVQVEILLPFVWHQEDPDTAFNQRLDLRPALTRLFLRNPSPDGESTVYVDAQASDLAANHPTHITTFRLMADVTIAK